MHMSFHTPQLSRGLKAAKHCIVSAAISAWLFAPAHPKPSPRATSELQFSHYLSSSSSVMNCSFVLTPHSFVGRRLTVRAMDRVAGA